MLILKLPNKWKERRIKKYGIIVGMTDSEGGIMC